MVPITCSPVPFDADADNCLWREISRLTQLPVEHFSRINLPLVLQDTKLQSAFVCSVPEMRNRDDEAVLALGDRSSYISLGSSMMVQ